MTNTPETKPETEATSPFTCFDLSISDERIAHIRMVRPERHNSMSAAFWKELPLVLNEIEANSKLRVAVMSAEGKTFCSGMDLSAFQHNLATETAIQRTRLKELILMVQGILNRVDRCRVPIIMAVQGGCIGGGLDMASAGMFRYATRSAYFTIHEINLAMMADLGTLQRLPRLNMPFGVIAELALTGDKFSATEAKRWGFVNEVFSSQEKMFAHAMSVAATIAQKSPQAIQMIRESLRDAQKFSIEDALAIAAERQAGFIDVNQVLAAIKAQKEGTIADFADRLPEVREL